MKKLFTIAALVAFTFSAYSQKDYETTDTITIDSSNLVVACQFGECDVFWQDNIIATEATYIEAPNVLTSLAVFGLHNLYIYTVYQGDGCPEAYRLLNIQHDKSYTLSETFGNCNSISKMHIKDDGATVEFQFDGDREMNRKKVTYVYDCKTFELKED